ncbi:MAG TPA: hypothetical protein VLT83_10805 [Opitutaceae bacterium]|nr:hypothetical protein [Opitutaceae bacterium]
MEQLQRLLEPLNAYPRWFVITCLVLVALGVFWLLAKAIKWALYLLMAAVLLALIVVAVGWLLG